MCVIKLNEICFNKLAHSLLIGKSTPVVIRRLEYIFDTLPPQKKMRQSFANYLLDIIKTKTMPPGLLFGPWLLDWDLDINMIIRAIMKYIPNFMDERPNTLIYFQYVQPSYGGKYLVEEVII